MKNKNFNEVLDYGIFKEDEMEPSQIPKDVDWSLYRYFTRVKIKSQEVITFRGIHSSMHPNEKDIGFLHGKRIMNGKFPLISGGWIILIEAGFLSKWLRIETFQSKGKKVEVETIFPYGKQINNPVFIDGQPAPDGKYSRGWFSSISVFDGKIV